MTVKRNSHEIEIYLEASEDEDLLIAMILILHVFYTYKFLNSLEEFLMIHLKFDKIIF